MGELADTDTGASRPPVDADVDLSVPAQVAELRRAPWSVLGVISAGGVCGAIGRFVLSSVWPHSAGGFPWSTFLINVSGCLLIGALMVVVEEAGIGHRLLRPFLGVGVLGGFTTFSTYVVDVQRAAAAGAAGVAFTYLIGTVVAALLAVWCGSALTRSLVLLLRRLRRRRHESPGRLRERREER